MEEAGKPKESVKKKLLRMPKGINEWSTLFMIVMVIFMAWAYKHDTAECRKVVDDSTYACQICDATMFPEKYLNHSNESYVQNITLNLSYFNADDKYHDNS